MLIAFLSIIGYFILGILWVFYCIVYAPKDVALAFYDNVYRDSVDYGWVLLNILFWPMVMILMIMWLLGGKFVKRLLDKRFGK